MSEFNKKMFFHVCVAAIGSGFQHGYNTGVINTPASYIKQWINTSSINKHGYDLDTDELTLIWSITTSIYCFGGIFGGLLSGFLSKYLGPKKSLVINNLFVITGALCEGIVKLDFIGFYELMIFGRFLIGVNSGINAGICTMYCCDISPISLRGTMGSMYQLWITISVMISMILGMKGILGNETLWVYLLIVPVIVVAVIQSVLLVMLTPESPRFLLIREDNESVEKSLKKLRKEGADIAGEMEAMQAENDKIKSLPPIKLKSFCKEPVLRKPLIIVIVMMLAQQLSGINAVVFYSGDIYRKQAGLSEHTAALANIGFSTVNVLMTIVSVYFIDKVGRKILLLIAYTGLAIDTVFLMLALLFKDAAEFIPYTSIVFIYLYIILFATGAGSIPWFIVSDMFEVNAKPIAQAIGVAVNWTANFFVALSFGPVENKIGSYVFLIYIVFLVLTVVFILFSIPETKNKPVPEVQQLILQGKTTWKSG